MKLPNSTVVLSGLLFLGAGFSNAENTASKRAIDNVVESNEIPPLEKPAPPVKLEPRKINCEFLLLQSEVDCSGLSRKTCDLLSWLHAGCKKASECAQAQGKEAKKCCDNADRLPFGAGVYYTGYMRACAPHYPLQWSDRPDFKDLPCGSGQDCTNGLSKGLCDMRGWEDAGCQQRAKCDAKIKDASELEQCCKEWPEKPEGLFSKLYQSRFDLKCLRK